MYLRRYQRQQRLRQPLLIKHRQLSQVPVQSSGATGVVVTSPVKATFSEPVQSWSSSTIFSVKNGAGTSFSGTIALSTDKKTVTFSHSSPFAPSTSYTVTITTGVKDLAGNAMTSTKTWSFTTAATHWSRHHASFSKNNFSGK